VQNAESFQQRSYELRVEDRGGCEFRSGRPYAVGDFIQVPLPHEPGGEQGSYRWKVMTTQRAQRAWIDAVLVLAPA
jgi:hypothetical protein